MLTNVGRVRVNENIKERRENLCSFVLFGRILMSSTRTAKKIIKNRYVPKNGLKIFTLLGKLLKTTVCDLYFDMSWEFLAISVLG
jgi:hypothetical protein